MRAVLSQFIAIVAIQSLATLFAQPPEAPQEGPMLVVTGIQGQPGEIRVQQNGKFQVLANVPIGTQLWPLESQSDFYRIIEPQSGKMAWIWNRDVTQTKYTQQQQDRMTEAKGQIGAVIESIRQREYVKAKTLCLKILAVAERELGTQHPDTASVYVLAAEICFDSGDYDIARKYYSSAIVAYRRMVGQRDMRTAYAESGLGITYLRLNQLAKAEPFLKSALTTSELRKGPDDSSTIVHRRNLADLLQSLRNHNSAIQLYEQVLASSKRTHGDNHAVTIGRELVAGAHSGDRMTRPVIFADPAYNLGADQIEGKSPSERSPLRFSDSASFPQLEASASEAAAIKPALETFCQTGVNVLLQESAQESAFKKLKSPQAVVVSTHGFFTVAKPESGGVEGGFDNPLLRCGLALAGCNNRREAADIGREDGILTGFEIARTDLRGTELVVLSACETGLGDIRNGDGVAGLRQAFQLAGAQSVISSLWQVEDGETARLMKDFFANLASGMTKSEALRQAQLTRINARRERYGAAHPFFWAAFTLTGQE